MMQSNVLRAAIAAALLACALPVVCAAPPSAEAERQAARAKTLLDSGSQRPELLAEALQAVKAALAAQPDFAPALVEKARLVMKMDGSPRSFVEADRLLRLAIRSDPKYGRAWTTLGYVQVQLGDPWGAGETLAKARELAPLDPWTMVNSAEQFEKIGNRGQALWYLELLKERGTDNPGAMREGMHRLVSLYVTMRMRDRAEALAEELGRKFPDDALLRGNYAWALVATAHDYEAGERRADEALRILDYRGPRATKSLARYAKWAAAKRDGQPPETVAALLAAARAWDPDASLVPTCAISKREDFAFLLASLVALEARREDSLRNC